MFRDERPFACALRALDRRDFESAEKAFSDLLSANGLGADQRAFLLNKRGVSRIGLERRELARADFDAALELRPRYAPALTNLGNLLLEAGEFDEAIARYERAISGDRDYALAYFNLSVAYKRVGRLAEAVRALRHAHRLERRATDAGSWRRPRRW